MTRPIEEPAGGLGELIREVLAAHGDRPALVSGDREWTHAELWRCAAAVAVALDERGVRPGDRVGVLVGHDVADVLALIGLARLGAAAVPVDPATPAERLAFVLGDAGCRHLLARPEHAEDLEVDGLSRHDLGALSEDAVAVTSDAAPASPDARAAAYVIYTSGSTGLPKGVEVSSGALAAHARSAAGAWGLRPEDRTLQFASLGFDVAQEELWATWAHGGCLVLNPEGVTTFAALAEHVRRHRVSVLQVPTAFWRVLVADPTIDPGPVRLVIIGSEAAWREDLVRWRDSAWADTDLINAYGPTEAVITATSFRLTPDAPLPEGPGVPVGRPLPGRAAWVRREDGSLTADPGAEGVLLVSGILAEGYLDRPDLTAERFPHRVGDREGPFYDTGDRVRILADGALEFLGRNDGQVKVRGFRIELEEIDAALGSAPGVHLGAAALLTRPGAEPTLGALLVADAATPQPDIALVRDHLARRLPAYMVPVRLSVAEEVPRTVNGKVDRDAVASLVAAAPTGTAAATDVAALEEPAATLLPLWRSVLGDDAVGPDDDFFSLGGDSLLVMQFTARARGAGWAVAPRSVLRARTLRRVSALATPVAEQGEASAALELLPAQHRWLRDGPLPDMGHFALVALFETRPRLTREQAVAVAGALVGAHPTLRTRLRAQGESLSIAAGKVRPERAVEHHEVERLDPETVERLCRETQQSLSPGAGRVLRLVLMDDAQGAQRLLLAAHHLTLDGWSMALLVEDLEHLVRQVVAGEEARLPAPPAGPGDLARAYADLAGSDEVAAWTRGWRDLPWAEVREHPRDGEGEALLPSLTFARATLGSAATSALLRGDGTRVVDAVQAAILTALAERTGHAVQGLDVYSHNRDTEQIDLDLSRTIGYVQATHPVVRRVEGASAAHLRELARTMATSTPPPFTFDLVRFLDGDAGESLRALPALDARLNYRGHLDRLEERAADSPLQEAEESTGPNRAGTQQERYLLMFEGDIVGDRLEISLKHSTDLLTAATADALVAGVVAHLETLAGVDD